MSLLLIMGVLFVGCSYSNMKQVVSDESLIASFYPVGKGDCILLQCEGESILIDAGYAENADDVISYLTEKNVTSLSAVIATHPDKDHIGGMTGMIESGIDIGVLYKTDVVKKNSDDYIAMMSAIKNKGIHVKNPKIGDSFLLGSATVTFLAPLSNQYDDVNNSSIVVKVTYAGQSMLFTGDILTEAENDLLNSTMNLNAAVLKVAHHGSSGTSSKKFLEAVNPQYAVITCNESDGHAPDNKVLKRLEKLDTTILRTDTEGLITITISSYGEIAVINK
ncbi:competence protein ComEC [Clostridium frigidicarnis]|uniref:Competence protein ComEC n=2 Tax=Clostridium frigidicarnis TaxID=84698 RepID=A0A1I0V7K0_9CLOT|nr:competence protein ComEC [Clostridium frigidicarnis]